MMNLCTVYEVFFLHLTTGNMRVYVVLLFPS